MLKKENRLKSNAAFRATYNNNNVIYNDTITLYAGKPKDDKSCPTRVGFVVSKKVHKRAVKRNKLKRLMRENVRLIFKSNQPETINTYKSLIFSAKTKALYLTNKEIYYNILTLLDKIANKNIQGF